MLVFMEILFVRVHISCTTVLIRIQLHQIPSSPEFFLHPAPQNEQWIKSRRPLKGRRKEEKEKSKSKKEMNGEFCSSAAGEFGLVGLNIVLVRHPHGKPSGLKKLCGSARTEA